MNKLFGFLGLMLLLSMIAPGDPNEAEVKYSLTAIHAHLYYHSTGKIDSTDLLDGKEYNLWNTIAGVGVAKEPSSTIMVLVDLVGPKFNRCEGRLRLTATDNQKILLDQTLELSLWFNQDGKVILPFFVPGTGCEHVEITATLEDLPASKVDTRTLTKTIPFECGE